MDLLAYMLASGDEGSNSKLWFWLIAVVVYFITKGIESFRSKGKDEETPVQDTENHHEKRVKEVIEEMRRTNPQPQRPQPARSQAPAHAPRPSASPVELPTPAVARKRRPAPEPMPEWAGGDAQQTAQNVLERYVKATEEAEQSMRSLSDAEQAALHRLQERELRESRPAPLPAIAVSEPLSLKDSLRRSQSLKTAILYQEILGKPRALRGVSFSGE